MLNSGGREAPNAWSCHLLPLPFSCPSPRGAENGNSEVHSFLCKILLPRKATGQNLVGCTFKEWRVEGHFWSSVFAGKLTAGSFRFSPGVSSLALLPPPPSYCTTVAYTHDAPSVMCVCGNSVFQSRTTRVTGGSESGLWGSDSDCAPHCSVISVLIASVLKLA